MYLERLAETALQQIVSGGKVGIVLGARQVGKTTLVKQRHAEAGRDLPRLRR